MQVIHLQSLCLRGIHKLRYVHYLLCMCLSRAEMREYMKKAKDDHKINTIPKGAYEGGVINQELRKNKNNSLNDITTDAQHNGYPTEQSKNRAGD